MATITIPNIPILTSEVDERLIMNNIGHCYGGPTLGFRVSVEHYRYLTEQIISLRQWIMREHPETRPEDAT